MYTFVILDDNTLLVSAMTKMISAFELPLQMAGAAYDGITGLQLIRQEQPDIVITDIRMPGYDGLQMLEKLREEAVSCKFMIVSGYGSFEYARRGIQLEASDFLLKPVAEEELRSALEKIIAALDAERKKEGAGGQQESYSPRVGAAMAWVAQHIHEPISLSDAAEAMGITTTHLSRIFKKETQQGFNAYVTQKKMEEAQRLLQNPQNKVYEVAEQLGYRDYAYFFQVFKKTFGYSPKDERTRSTPRA